MTGYLVDDATPEEIEAERATYAPIAEALRELAEASIRTTVSPEVAADAAARLAEVRDLLTASVGGESYGLKWSRQRHRAAVGQRGGRRPQPRRSAADGRARARGACRRSSSSAAAYEGPPAFVHGGVSALILDQLLGEAAAQPASRA